MVSSGRPFVTFALFAYNQERYIAAAIAAAFAQTFSPLEIILSDDCSSDHTFEIMQRAAAGYEGPHRVILNRNARNLNIGAHVNRLAELSSGDLIVLAAGDDISLPQRTEKMWQRWLDLGRSPAVLHSDYAVMDNDGNCIDDLVGEAVYRGSHDLEAMARGVIQILGATTAIARSVFTAFPPMSPAVVHEDRVLPFRALLLRGSISLVDEKLVRYRVTGGVSRDQALTAREYLFRQLPSQCGRTLPDAIQRLRDMELAMPDDFLLRAACLATISDHEIRIDLARQRGLGVEKASLRAIRKGARVKALLTLYLKHRFYPLFRLYFHYKFGHEIGMKPASPIAGREVSGGRNVNGM